MSIEKLIGNTPMVKIRVRYEEKIVNVFVKLEYYNYTGSIKDRVAYYIINESYKNGSLKEGMPIIEATSGNTGIAFSALGAYYGHPVHIFMPDSASVERIKIMELYGAKVYLVSKEDGGFKEAIRRADELAKEINGFRPDQFNNIMNVDAHYNTTGLEILNKLDKIDLFVSGIGTGGTLIGIAKRLKESFKNMKVVAMEPLQLPIMSKGINVGKHKIEGIGDDFIPSIVDFPKFIDVETEEEVKEDGNYYTVVGAKAKLEEEKPHKITKSLSKKRLVKRYLKAKGIKDEQKKEVLLKVLKEADNDNI